MRMSCFSVSLCTTMFMRDVIGKYDTFCYISWEGRIGRFSRKALKILTDCDIYGSATERCLICVYCLSIACLMMPCGRKFTQL